VMGYFLQHVVLPPLVEMGQFNWESFVMTEILQITMDAILHAK